MKGIFSPSTGRVDARGVASRSPALEDRAGGELMIMPSSASRDGRVAAGPAGEDWKKRGDEDVTAAPLTEFRLLFGVAVGCRAGVDDCELRDEWPRRREDGVDDIVVGNDW